MSTLEEVRELGDEARAEVRRRRIARREWDAFLAKPGVSVLRWIDRKLNAWGVEVVSVRLAPLAFHYLYRPEAPTAEELERQMRARTAHVREARDDLFGGL